MVSTSPAKKLNDLPHPLQASLHDALQQMWECYCQVACEGKERGGIQREVNRSIDQAVEGARQRAKVCRFCTETVTTNLQVSVHYAIKVAMIYTF